MRKKETRGLQVELETKPAALCAWCHLGELRPLLKYSHEVSRLASAPLLKVNNF